MIFIINIMVYSIKHSKTLNQNLRKCSGKMAISANVHPYFVGLTITKEISLVPTLAK